MDLNVAMARVSANSGDVCGDAAHFWIHGPETVLAIADGLGHGADAAQAANAAMNFIAEHLDLDLIALFQELNAAMERTRGAAVAVARVRPDLARIEYAAIGNTRAAVFGWSSTRLDAEPGIVGTRRRRLRPLNIPFRAGDCLALWTDGLRETLKIDYGATTNLDALAATLMTEYATGDDDRCVILARRGGS
ncbi:MAG TPA: SpoIIE family protein phosphatase [Azospirillaceae bacterium]|nr:SpoIIE family protein phosphatase [Azospirillaceae bacterium]HRQ79733.1 SpoIIE family protein phosphatase [Azospirillaceae bacterium]